MNEVTLTWSLKNFVTVNLMVFAAGAVMVAISQAIKTASKRTQSND